jgi:hypothetical protein
VTEAQHDACEWVAARGRRALSKELAVPSRRRDVSSPLTKEDPSMELTRRNYAKGKQTAKCSLLATA